MNPVVENVFDWNIRARYQFQKFLQEWTWKKFLQPKAYAEAKHLALSRFHAAITAGSEVYEHVEKNGELRRLLDKNEKLWADNWKSNKPFRYPEGFDVSQEVNDPK